MSNKPNQNMGFVPAYSAPTQPDGGQVKTQED